MNTTIKTVATFLLTLTLSLVALSTAAFACGSYGDIDPVMRQQKVVWYLESSVQATQTRLSNAVEDQDTDAITQAAAQLTELNDQLKTERARLEQLRTSKAAVASTP